MSKFTILIHFNNWILLFEIRTQLGKLKWYLRTLNNDLIKKYKGNHLGNMGEAQVYKQNADEHFPSIFL